MKKLTIFCCLLFCCLGSNAASETPPKSAIASAHPFATQAGFVILEKGGNAFDAAVAVAATLGVVEPYSSGLGGGGFWMLHIAKTGETIMVDGREKAPSLANRDMYQDRSGNVVREWATNGPLAAGIPGQAAALAHITEKYGKLTLKDNLLPAISFAESGFPVNPVYQRMAKYRAEVISEYTESRNTFLQNRNAPFTGFIVTQPNLGKTLEYLAEYGHEGFYAGELAQRMVEEVQAAGGIWKLEDLNTYRIVEREPVIGEYKGAKIISAAPPSSGGIVMVEALNILENFGFGKLDKHSLAHLSIESMRLAYYDRARYLGDPDFVQIPLDKLVSKEYATELSASIKMDRPQDSATLGEKIDVQQGDHTTHLSIIDQQGNMVSATLSINLPFGSGFVIPGTGILLNNEMDDFSAKPGEPNAYGLVGSGANAIEPGKRPLSSMTPTFVEYEDKVAIVGTPGGSRIISMVMLAVQEFLDGKPPIDWVSRPRFHHQYLPDVVEVEPDVFYSDSGYQLQKKGHKLRQVKHPYGNMQAIMWDKKNNTVEAASDPRGIGKADAYSF